MKRSIVVWGLAMVLGAVGTVLANPPGPIDGRNIPVDFGATNRVAIQATWTGFGNSEMIFGAMGSEMDRLYVGKSTAGGNLILSITGNLETNGNAFVILLDTQTADGQNKLRTELVGGPPFAVQNLGMRTFINTNGTTNGLDDFLQRDPANPGLGFDAGFEPDWAVAVDLYSAIGYASLYDLSTNAFPEVFNDPATTIVETLPLYTRRCYLGSFVVNTGDGTISGGGTGSPDNACTLMAVTGTTWKIAFNDLNINGVLGTGDLPATGDPATATTGLEIVVPLTELGISPTQEVKVQALLLSSGGGVSNQSLPGLALSFIKDLSLESARYPQPDFATTNGTIDYKTLNLGTQATMATPTPNGDITDAGYGSISQALQTAATTYGDQKVTPQYNVLVVRSELDELYVTSDATNLYLGITGNAEFSPNNNRMLVFIDSIPGTGVQTLVSDLMDSSAARAMHGDSLPVNAAGLPVYYDYAIETNIYSGIMYVDLFDLNTNGPESKTWLGGIPINSGSGIPNPVGDVDDPCLLFALDDTNVFGVTGCGGPTDACFSDSVATVQAAAATATTGWEMAIPFSLLGADPIAGNVPVNVWAMITSSPYGAPAQTWRSNQSLPTLRKTSPQFVTQVVNPGQVVTNYSIAWSAFPDPEPTRNYAARTGPHTAPKILNLADCRAFDFDLDRDVDLYDFRKFQACFGPSILLGCDLGDYDLNNQITLTDYKEFHRLFVGP